jgi:hypothetical protein
MVGDKIIPDAIANDATCCKSINSLTDPTWCDDLKELSAWLLDYSEEFPERKNASLEQLMFHVRSLRRVIEPLTLIKDSINPDLHYRNLIPIGDIPALSLWHIQDKYLLFDDDENSKTLIFCEWEKQFELEKEVEIIKN